MNIARKELLERLAEKMFSVMRCLHAGQCFRYNETVLRPPQVRILLFIAKYKEELAVKHLAEILNVTPGAVTQFVDGLVDMGLVRREEDTRDRRIIRIKLTGRARSKLEEFRKGYLASANRVFDILSDEEIRELVRILAKVDTNTIHREAESGLTSR